MVDKELFFAYGTSTANSGASHPFIAPFKTLWNTDTEGTEYVFCTSWETVSADEVLSEL